MSAQAAGTRLKQTDAEKRHQLKRRNLSENRKKLKLRTFEKFHKLSPDGEWLPESEIEKLLAMALRKGEKELQPDAVQLVADTAHRSQEKVKLSPPKDLDQGAFHIDHLLRAIQKYGEYISKARTIDDVFHKYDKEKDGYLTRNELKKALQSYERKANRAKNGFTVSLQVTEEDVDWIIGECDLDLNGMISHAEYLPAIAAWEEVAQMKLEDEAKCVVM